MHSLRKISSGPGLDLQTIPAPESPGAHEVILKVLATGICGTDLHIAEWTPSYRFMAPRLPVTIGHEFSGRVAAVGSDVGGLALGQLVTARPSVTCGQCDACLSARYDDCTSRQGIGVARDGAFAGWVRLPARNCVPVPGGVDPIVAALAEPLSVSWESVRTAGIRPGHKVLVLGPGNIGQGIAIFARAAGARQVVVVGREDSPRLNILRGMGFTDLIDLSGSGMDEALEPYVAEGRFDVVIEATGAGSVIAPALKALKPHGVLVVTGIHPAPVPIDLTALVRGHQEIRGSYRAPESAWPQVILFMQEHGELLMRMITHRVSLEDAMKGFELAHSRQATKVMVLP